MTRPDSLTALSGSRLGNMHKFQVRVYYEDTDAGGIVYHANYLHFAERARTEFLRLVGIGQDAMRREDGAGFAVRRCEIDFRAPARLDDMLEVRTVLRDPRGARVSALQSIHMVTGGKADEDWLVRLDLMLACINQHGRPVRLPERVRTAFADVLGTD
ncbi:MAG: tol-pal system-associated acyl-CoA thioesterase [Proteobacteria bacterium]|nr:tol-pal system-associated acyl-CoA thioesterase [Pseudomonadota bacterium]